MIACRPFLVARHYLQLLALGCALLVLGCAARRVRVHGYMFGVTGLVTAEGDTPIVGAEVTLEGERSGLRGGYACEDCEGLDQ